MKFVRDILLIDLECTGQNPEKDFILQISALLLDKDNLLQKDVFNSYIRHSFSQTTNDRIIQTLGISKEQLMQSPGLKETIQAFNNKFPNYVTLASHNMVNVNFLRAAYSKINLPYDFDYHILELWTLGYVHLCKMNIRKIPTAETLGLYLKIPKTKEHDAMVNCRFLAEVLRKIIYAH